MDQVRAKRMAADLKGQPVGDWVVGDYLGNGASAVVVSAERQEQVAALKVIDPEMAERHGAEQELHRVELESSLSGHDHPHLIQIFDGGLCSETGYLYVVMELLTFPRLTSLVPAFPRERIGPIIEQLASAARFLESREIAHRDIKPDNILVTRDCDRAVLLDLGVIRVIADDERAEGGTGDEFLGTTRYSPPEFVNRDEEDSPNGWRAVTFYQLGAVLHDLIMRRRMFDEVRAPPAKLIDAVRTTRPFIEAADVSPHLVSLSRNCLHKDWRIRLELVGWDSFSDSPPEFISGSAKDRIRQRLGSSAEGADVAGPEALHVVEAQRRQMLEQAGGRLASTIREICLQGGLFPPITVDHIADGDQRQIVVIRTGPSATHSLENILEIVLSVELLDDDGLLVRVNGISAQGARPEEIPTAAWRHVFSGEMVAPGMPSRLDDFVHVALDTAQTIGSSPENRLIDLDWPD